MILFQFSILSYLCFLILVNFFLGLHSMFHKDNHCYLPGL